MSYRESVTRAGGLAFGPRGFGAAGQPFYGAGCATPVVEIAMGVVHGLGVVADAIVGRELGRDALAAGQIARHIFVVLERGGELAIGGLAGSTLPEGQQCIGVAPLGHAI